MTPDTKGSMSAEHKAALAEGRTQAKAVRQYLEALEAHKPKRGRKRTPESIKKRLDAIEDRSTSADPLKRLHSIQERIDLETELGSMEDKPDLARSRRTSSSAPRATASARASPTPPGAELGVDAATLKAAGITRGG